MQHFSKILCTSIIILGLTASSLALADPQLTITNQDPMNDSAVKITSGGMKGTCSGDRGVYTPKNSQKTVPWNAVKNLFCQKSGDICTAEIHMTQHCTDSAEGIATLHLSSGAIDVTAISKNYTFSSSPYHLTITKLS